MSERELNLASDGQRKSGRKERKQISFRVSDDEFLKLKMSADTLGMSVPAFVKKKAQGSRLVTPKLDEETRKIVARDLSSIGNNLNQIARVLNAKRYIEHDDINRNFEKLREEVNELWQQLN